MHISSPTAINKNTSRVDEAAAASTTTTTTTSLEDILGDAGEFNIVFYKSQEKESVLWLCSCSLLVFFGLEWCLLGLVCTVDARLCREGDNKCCEGMR